MEAEKTKIEEGFVDLSGDGGILKKILKEGDGECPPQGSNVIVHYNGTLTDGTKFDSSRDRGQEFKFRLGKGQVIKGWDQGVATMKKGELAILTCRYDYAYGEAGNPPTIPQKATLNFEVELFGWDDAEPETAPEKIKAASKKKDEGNALFKEAKYKEASMKYEQAVDFFKQVWGLSEDEKKEIENIKLPCLLNLAACQLKTKDYADCVLTCSKALDIDNKNVKALYRRGQAHSLNGEFDKAKEDLTEAVHLSPKSKEIRDELEKLKKNIQDYKLKQKEMFSGVFDKMKKNTTPTPTTTTTSTSTSSDSTSTNTTENTTSTATDEKKSDA